MRKSVCRYGIQCLADLGAGTGAGTVALAARFTGARIHALDASATMIERILAPAVASGVSTQVETHLVDLDGDWPSVAPDGADIAWASLSLHHTSNPARVLQQVFDLLRPGGVAVVTEFTGATRYSPTDLGTTSEGLGERIVAALAAQGYPVTADWAPQLAAAGFGPIERHESFVTVSAATSVGARFLELHLTRSRELLRPPA